MTPDLEVLRVYCRDGHAFTDVQFFHPDGSDWFKADIYMQGREGGLHPIAHHADGSRLMDNNRKAPRITTEGLALVSDTRRAALRGNLWLVRVIDDANDEYEYLPTTGTRTWKRDLTQLRIGDPIKRLLAAAVFTYQNDPARLLPDGADNRMSVDTKQTHRQSDLDNVLVLETALIGLVGKQYTIVDGVAVEVGR